MAGPPKLTTSSEVATIKYLHCNTTVSVPKILDWSVTNSNAIGSEYIIMEEATGVQLQHCWENLSIVQQLRCVAAICKNIEQVAALPFPVYGSLYFADISVGADHNFLLGNGFCIGPHCGTKFWGNKFDKREVSPEFNRGPWLDKSTFCRCLIDAGLSRLPPDDSWSEDRPNYHGSVADHVQLLETGHHAIQRLFEESSIQNASCPTLLHPDLHTRNIFASEEDPTTVTGIIDWQSSSIEPAFMYADEIPDFADAINRLSIEAYPKEFNAVLCAEAFDACLRGWIPRLPAARALDENLLRPFRYCYRTWNNGAVPFRQESIDLSLRWNELGLLVVSPYSPPEDMERHQKEYSLFEAAYERKPEIMSLLNTPSDGWVPLESWEKTAANLKIVYQQILSDVVEARGTGDNDDRLTPEEFKRLWPYDVE